MASLLAVPLLAACEADCHTGILYDVSPRDRVLEVGASFTPAATVQGCRDPRSATLIWATGDSSVAIADRNTGETTGLAPGETWLGGWDGDTIIGHAYVEVNVEVVAP